MLDVTGDWRRLLPRSSARGALQWVGGASDAQTLYALPMLMSERAVLRVLWHAGVARWMG